MHWFILKEGKTIQKDMKQASLSQICHPKVPRVYLVSRVEKNVFTHRIPMDRMWRV